MMASRALAPAQPSKTGQFSTGVNTLNNLKSDKILTGQKLLVPIWPKAQSK
jgi:hypothetical protein